MKKIVKRFKNIFFWEITFLNIRLQSYKRTLQCSPRDSQSRSRRREFSLCSGLLQLLGRKSSIKAFINKSLPSEQKCQSDVGGCSGLVQSCCKCCRCSKADIFDIIQMNSLEDIESIPVSEIFEWFTCRRAFARRLRFLNRDSHQRQFIIQVVFDVQHRIT